MYRNRLGTSVNVTQPECTRGFVLQESSSHRWHWGTAQDWAKLSRQVLPQKQVHTETQRNKRFCRSGERNLLWGVTFRLSWRYPSHFQPPWVSNHPLSNLSSTAGQHFTLDPSTAEKSALAAGCFYFHICSHNSKEHSPSCSLALSFISI